MAKKKGMPLETFMKLFSTKAQSEEYLTTLRWEDGYVGSKCGYHHGYSVVQRSIPLRRVPLSNISNGGDSAA